MKTINKLIQKIQKAKERSEIFQALIELDELRMNFSVGNITISVMLAIQKLKKDFKTNITIAEALFFIKYFHFFLSLDEFKSLCILVLTNSSNSLEIVTTIVAVENYPEIFTDEEDDLLIMCRTMLDSLNDQNLSKIIVEIPDIELQESMWRMINFKMLDNDSKDFLLNSQNWYFVSYKIVFDIYRMTYNGNNKNLPNSVKIQLLHLLQLVPKDINTSQIVDGYVESLCRSILDTKPMISEILLVRSFFGSFGFGTMYDYESISQSIYLNKKSIEDYIFLYNSGYFTLFENTLLEIKNRYQKNLKWFLRNYQVLQLRDDDEYQLDQMLSSFDGKMYLEYLDIKEAESFFKTHKKDIGL